MHSVRWQSTFQYIATAWALQGACYSLALHILESTCSFRLIAILRVPSGPSPGLLKDSSVDLNTADSDQFYPKAPCHDLSSYIRILLFLTEGSWLIGKPQPCDLSDSIVVHLQSHDIRTLAAHSKPATYSLPIPPLQQWLAVDLDPALSLQPLAESLHEPRWNGNDNSMRPTRPMHRLFASSKHAKRMHGNRPPSSREYSIWAWRIALLLRHKLQLLRPASRKSCRVPSRMGLRPFNQELILS
jgi:hypothetical protein